MRKISIYEGKNKFSEIVANAAKGEVQVITKNGQETAVVISIEDYKKLKGKETPIGELLRTSPLRGSGIDLTRDKSPVRTGPDFSDE